MRFVKLSSYIQRRLTYSSLMLLVKSKACTHYPESRLIWKYYVAANMVPAQVIQMLGLTMNSKETEGSLDLENTQIQRCLVWLWDSSGTNRKGTDSCNESCQTGFGEDQLLLLFLTLTICLWHKPCTCSVTDRSHVNPTLCSCTFG